MNQDLGLRVLGSIMAWSDDTSRREYAWLRLMARLKYDGYRDFQAGMRFIESLATWLQQFDVTERQTAYNFVRHSLVYLGPAELQHLVEQFFPSIVRPRLFRTVTMELGLRFHEVLTHPNAQSAWERALRRTLIMGLSDGARIDTIRHANAGVLSNEQVVHSTQIDPDKWKDLLDNLHEDLGDPRARFLGVYLLDDFAGTGSSFLRFDESNDRWIGKLVRFRDSVDRATKELGSNLFTDQWELYVHYYVASALAAKTIQKRIHELPRQDSRHWPNVMRASFGMRLPETLPLDSVTGRYDDFIALTQKYYNPRIRTRHTDIGGSRHLGLGYGGSALPVVLEHNTPNNSVALLWAETDGGRHGAVTTTPMRPLFRRRERHT